MCGFGIVVGQVSFVGYLGYDVLLELCFDLDKVCELMVEVGYVDGFLIMMMVLNNCYVNDDCIVQVVVLMLLQINISVDFQIMFKVQYWFEFDECVVDMMMIGWYVDIEDLVNFYQFLIVCFDVDIGNGQYNLGNYCNLVVDVLMDVLNMEIDIVVCVVLLIEFEGILYEEVVFILLYWQNFVWGVKDNMNVGDIVNVLNFFYFGDFVVIE